MSGNKNRIMFTVGAILTYVKCHVRILPDTHFFCVRHYTRQSMSDTTFQKSHCLAICWTLVFIKVTVQHTYMLDSPVAPKPFLFKYLWHSKC